MITFNNIVERFKIFADAHFFVKSFSFGSPDDVDLSKFTSFPLMHLVYTGATYDAGTKTYNLEVYILDVPADKTKKTDRQKEVVSDAEQCAEDIIADIKNGGNIFLFAQDYEVVNATTTPLEEETKNVLSGVLLDLSVAIPYEWDACNAPIDGVSPEGGDEVAYARRGILRMLTQDGSTDVLSVRTIKVTNGTLTDDGDGVVTLDTGGASSLDDLDDVTLTAPLATGQVIVYDRDASPRGFHNQENSLANLTDTQVSGAAAGTILSWNGAYWVPAAQSTPPATTDALSEGTTNLYYTEARVSANTDVAANTAKVGITAQQASDITTNNAKTSFPGFGTTAGTALEGDTTTITTDQANAIAANTAKVGITTQQADDITANNAKVSLIAGGTTGQALVKSTGTDYDVEWADIAVDVQYHDRYATESETLRAGGAETIELYYSAQADGDGLAESASSDTPAAGYDIRRKLYYSEAGFADPDTGTWTQFTAIADNTTFANAKTALLAYLKQRTGGTVPISLKMTWEEVAQAPAFTGLLNESYGSGAEAAYSTRRLNGNVTECMVIRRASDSTTTTIGFDGSGNIDEAAIETFCSGTTCTVSEWKDQSGNGNDATQSDPTKQPTIYTGGALVKENGKVILLPQSNGGLTTGLSLSGTANVFTVQKQNQRAMSFGDLTSNSRYIGQAYTSGNAYAGVSSVAFGFNGATTITTNSASTFASNTISQTLVYFDFSATISNLVLGYWNHTSIPMFQLQEVVLYTSDKSSDRTDIESNIGDYFTQNTPLLDTYSGAAAAYSLRLLDSTYTGALVEVYNGSSYADIGANVFGELDTVALAAHCGSNNGFVSKWYDQSGNTNTAAQATTANMPKIYDGTTGVVTENGKPAVQADDTPQSLGFTSTSVGSAFMVYRKTADKVLSTLIGGSSAQQIDGGGTSSSFGKAISVFDGSAGISGTTAADNSNQYLASVHLDTSDSVRLNGSQENTGTIGSVNVARIFQRQDLVGDSRYVFVGRIQEVIIYSTAQIASDITNIEDNINTFYNIYS